MAPRYKRIVDVIGGIDWFGTLNSRPDMDVKAPYMAWHHTNTELWFTFPSRGYSKT